MRMAEEKRAEEQREAGGVSMNPMEAKPEVAAPAQPAATPPPPIRRRGMSAAKSECARMPR